MRFLAHILALVLVVSSTLAAVPCACEAGGSHLDGAEPASDEERGCCAGATEKPEEPTHDCPHCLSGACDIDGLTSDAEATPVANGRDVISFEFEIVGTTGFETQTIATAARVPQRRALEWIGPGDSGWARCVQNQVIRC